MVKCIKSVQWAFGMASALPNSATFPPPAGAQAPGDAIIVGAGPAGLACAAMMREAGLEPRVIEKTDTIASVWRRHYESLHPHSERAFSALPGLPMSRSYSRFPSRQQVVEYLEAYASKFAIRPKFRTEARRLKRNGTNWDVDCGDCKLSARNIVIAVGWASFPFRPDYPGVGDYCGQVIHSNEHKNATAYAAKRLLVVGYGNSEGEIALDLARNGVEPALSVRGSIQVMPRISTVTIGEFQRRVPVRLADIFNTPLIVLTTGNLKKLGLSRINKGPRRLIAEHNRVPTIDAGTLRKIREGRIKSAVRLPVSPVMALPLKIQMKKPSAL